MEGEENYLILILKRLKFHFQGNVGDSNSEKVEEEGQNNRLFYKFMSLFIIYCLIASVLSFSCFGETNTKKACNYPQGTCSKQDVCTCATGFVGWRCENYLTCNGVLYNSSNVCNGQGNCVRSDMYQKGSCNCKGIYYGTNCQNYLTCNGIMSNSSTVCNGGGTCTLNSTSGVGYCNCNSYRTGTYCDTVLTCNGVAYNSAGVCSGHGTCSKSGCSCSTGYSGSNCEVENQCNGINGTKSNVCNGKGKCLSTGKCQCSYSSYYGDYCENIIACNGILANSSSVCSGHGYCYSVSGSTTGTCLCISTYTGSDCSTQITCYGISKSSNLVCSGHGTCSDVDTCSCDSGFYESDCGVPYTCFGYQSNSSQVCSGRGSCTATDTCDCTSTPYQGPNCSTIYTCFGIRGDNTSYVCNGNGYCTATDTCYCSSSSYYGDKCDIPTNYYIYYNSHINKTADPYIIKSYFTNSKYTKLPKNVCFNYSSTPISNLQTMVSSSNSYYSFQFFYEDSKYGLKLYRDGNCGIDSYWNTPSVYYNSTRGYSDIKAYYDIYTSIGFIPSLSSPFNFNYYIQLRSQSVSNYVCSTETISYYFYYLKNYCYTSLFLSCDGNYLTNTLCNSSVSNCAQETAQATVERYECFASNMKAISISQTFNTSTSYSMVECYPYGISCNGVEENDASVCASHGYCAYQDVCKCYTGYFGYNCDASVAAVTIGLVLGLGFALCIIIVIVISIALIIFFVLSKKKGNNDKEMNRY